MNMTQQQTKRKATTNIDAMGGGLTAEIIEKQARLWQSEAFTKFLGLEQQRMTVKAATGAGKTYLAIMVVLWWLKKWLTIEEKDGRTVKTQEGVVIFCVPSKDLVIQTYNAMRGFQLYSIARVSSAFKNEHRLDKEIYITTYSSLHKVLAKCEGKKVLIIGDECHKMGSEGNARQFINFQGDACLLLSATPERSDGMDVMSLMNAPIHVEVSLIEGIKQSRGEDDSLDFTVYYTIVNASPSETIALEAINEEVNKKYNIALSAVKKAGGWTNNLFDKRNENFEACYGAIVSYKKACMDRKRLENDIEGRYDIARAIMRNNIGEKYAIFHESIFGIERLNEMCMSEGIKPHIYHSGMELSEDQALQYPELNTPAFRKRLKQYAKDAPKHLQRWTESSSDFLLTCKSLKEGFDVPDMDGVVMITGTNSVRSRIQTIGRVFRGRKHKKVFMLILQGGEGSSGDERCFWNIIEETGIPQENIKYITHSMLLAGEGGVDYEEENEYISWGDEETHDYDLANEEEVIDPFA